MNKFSVLILSFVLLFLVTACSSGDEGSPIEFTGVITAIDGDIITVGGFSVDISSASVPVVGVSINEEVRITGLSEGATIIAIVVVVIDETTDDPTEEPEATAAPEVTDAAPPEETDAAPEATDEAPEATEAPESTDEAPVIIVGGDPLIIIEGAVESITINTITIFDIDIEVDPGDPILTEIRIGDTIRIEGISSFDGLTIIIIAVNITIIETTIIIINNPVFIAPGIPSNCRVKKSGKITCKGSRRGSRRS